MIFEGEKSVWRAFFAHHHKTAGNEILLQEEAIDSKSTYMRSFWLHPTPSKLMCIKYSSIPDKLDRSFEEQFNIFTFFNLQQKKVL